MNIPGHSQRVLALGLGKTGAWFAVSRAIQLAAGVWVTRQLDPDDFTLIAVIFAIQGLVQKVTALNLSSELVRAESIDRQDLDVAWSYELMRNIILCVVLVGFAPLLAGWMGHPEVAGGLRLSACGLLIGALRNPRLVELRREGLFGRLGWIESVPMFAYAGFAVLFVWLQPNFLSLIYAGLASSIFGAVATFHRLPYLPRLSFDFQRLRPMLSFGIVLLAGAGFLALREHGIVFVVSAGGFISDLGFLNRGIAFSMALAIQAVALFWRVGYPHYAKVHLEGGDAVGDARIANRWLLIAGLPTALLVCFFSDTLINLVIGAKWQPVAPLWAWLVVSGAVLLSNAPLEACLQAIRRERVQVSISALSTVLYLVTAWVLLPTYGIKAVGIAACASVFFSSVSLNIVLARSREGVRRCQAGTSP